MQYLKEQLPEEIYKNLESYAYKQSTLFCYSCYEDAPSGRCKKCHSDDLMRKLPGSGVEYGIEWVMESLIEDSCSPITPEKKEAMLEGIYPETTQIGWLKYNTISAIKELDPISFDIAVSEHIYALKEDKEIFEIGSHYWVDDLEQMLKENTIPQEKGA